MIHNNSEVETAMHNTLFDMLTVMLSYRLYCPIITESCQPPRECADERPSSRSNRFQSAQTIPAIQARPRSAPDDTRPPTRSAETRIFVKPKLCLVVCTAAPLSGGVVAEAVGEGFGRDEVVGVPLFL
jgi:hypothetical protein